jgi:hypothetical protein
MGVSYVFLVVLVGVCNWIDFRVCYVLGDIQER